MNNNIIKSSTGILNLLLCFILIIGLSSCSKDDKENIEKVQNTVYGKILDTSNGLPLQGVSVTIYPGGHNYITGSDGMYEFNNLINDTYIVQIKKNGYLSQVGNISFDLGNYNAHLDFSIKKGENSLDVLFGSMNFKENSMSKSFIITNTGNDTIEWSDYP